MATQKDVYKVILHGEDVTHRIKSTEVLPTPFNLKIKRAVTPSLLQGDSIKLTFLNGSSDWYSHFECEVIVLLEA